MYKAFVDGACRPNPGRGAYGFIIYNNNGSIVKRGSGFVGNNTTNTVAEYIAIMKAMETALEMGIDNLTVYSDSQVVVRQLSGIYGVYKPGLKKLKEKAAHLAGHFAIIQFVHVPRQQNVVANAIVERFLLAAQ